MKTIAGRKTYDSSSDAQDDDLAVARDQRVADPTILTTQQLMREVRGLKELVFTRLDAMDKAIELFNANVTRVPTDTDKQIQHLKELHEAKLAGLVKHTEHEIAEVNASRKMVQEVLETRLNGMDTAIELLQATANMFPNRIDEKIEAVAKVHQEKFNGVQKQFDERDTRVEQTARDTKVAVDAALQAAEKAVGKQNESFALSINKSEAATTKQIDQQSSLLQIATDSLRGQIDDIKARLTRAEGLDVGQKTAVTTQQTSNQGMVGVISLVMGGLIGAAGLLVAFLRHAG